MTEIEGIARSSMKSAGWNMAANTVMTLCGFIRTFALARLLAVETFGVYGKATAFVMLAVPLLYFGFGTAMMYRSEETEDEKLSSAVVLTLTLIFSLLWTVVMVVAANFFFDLSAQAARSAFYVVILSEAFNNINMAASTLLARRIDYRRLSVVVVIHSLVGTILSILFAFYGLGIWSLLVVNIVMVAVRLFSNYVWRPIMPLRLAWNGRVVRFYLHFGFKRTLEALLSSILDRIDDLWTAARLGDLATGLYTQAHIVARYPLKIISLPVIAVAQSTFNALKNEKDALVQSFEYVNSFLARLSFFIGGAVLLVSREFVILYLGEKWLPLLTVLRIMVLYMMIEPINKVVSDMLSSLGKPELAVRARAWQLFNLMVGLALFAWLLPWGIVGVAIAVNISVLLGLVIMAVLLRPHLQTSWRNVFLQPAAAVLVAGSAVYFTFHQFPIANVWLSALAKASLWTLLFVAVELLIDRAHLKELLRTGRKYLRKT